MPKCIRDPIYGFIHVPDLYLPIVDHRIVQRLRWVSQLPLEQLVYPSAQHSRFEHSIGTMYLARKAAERLIDNSPNEFKKIAKKDDLFSKKKPKERESLFIDAAGLVGLLHDVGHAPFSHTMEDACKHSSKLTFKYNHEAIGYDLSKKILDSANISKEYKDIVLYTLNKSIKTVDLPPLTALLRNIIDGPIDVDKGDYLLRDSYHCGVVYGVYDYNRLWDNIIIITNTSKIGVDQKGALEAWSLRIARYKMFSNVYKHHIRNITDALLIETITIALDGYASSMHKILPIASENDLNVEEKIIDFCFWNDTSLLEALNSIGDASIKAKIEKFTTRNLYKKCSEFNLSEDFSELTNYNEPLLHKKIHDVKCKLAKEKIDINYVLYKKPLPPIYEDEVQQLIRVKKGDTFVSLANFLDFSKKQNEDDESFIVPIMLYIFTSKSDLAYTIKIKKEINSMLSEFNVTKSVKKSCSKETTSSH